MVQRREGSHGGDRRVLVVLFFLLSPAAFLTTASQDGPLPDQEPFFSEVRENMARANREQVRYGYKERRTELHTNPFGHLGTGDVVLYAVTPGPSPSITFRTLLERNGRVVEDSKAEKKERQVRTGGPSAVDDTVATLQFSIVRRELLNGRQTIIVRFTPRRDANPQTREGKLAKMFSGSIWVDEAAREVTRVEATAVEDLSYGFGLLAKVRKGSVVTLTRERIDDHLWLPTSVKFKGDGRALLALRKLNIDFAVEWFDYKRH